MVSPEHKWSSCVFLFSTLVLAMPYRADPAVLVRVRGSGCWAQASTHWLSFPSLPCSLTSHLCSRETF